MSRLTYHYARQYLHFQATLPNKEFSKGPAWNSKLNLAQSCAVLGTWRFEERSQILTDKAHCLNIAWYDGDGERGDLEQCPLGTENDAKWKRRLRVWKRKRR